MIKTPVKTKMAPFLLVFILALGGLFYFFSTRSLSAEQIIKRAQQKEKKITSYYTLLETAINLGSSMQRYHVEVWFQSPHFYRVEISLDPPGEGSEPEQIFVSDGVKTWIYSPEIGDFYEQSLAARDIPPPPFLLVTFLKELSRVQEVTLINTEKTAEGTYYLLKVVPPFPGQKHAWEKVWLEKKTLLPAQIHIYDLCDRLQQTVIFHKTEINPPIEQELFKI